jgi:hypothetical protein
MQIDPVVTGITAIVILFAAFIHGIAGFGAAQVGMGVLPFFRSSSSSSIIITFVSLVANFRVLYSVRNEFHFANWLIPVTGLVVGMPIGILVFQELNEAAFRMTIGISLAIGVVLIATLRMTDMGKRYINHHGDAIDRKYGIIAGAFAGILGGSIAVPGPPMILYGSYLLHGEEWTEGQTKAAFTAFFGTLMSYRLVALIALGQLTYQLSLEALMVMPALAIGSGLGILVYNCIDEEKFRWLVLIGLACNAAILILTSFPEI